jgi:hypothetical protein
MDATDQFIQDMELELQIGEVDTEEFQSTGNWESVTNVIKKQKRKIYPLENKFIHCTNTFQSEGFPPCNIDNVVCTYSIGHNSTSFFFFFYYLIGIKPNLRNIGLNKRNSLNCKFNPSKFAAMVKIENNIYI